MLTETRFINNSRSKHPFVDIGNQEKNLKKFKKY